MSEDKQKLLNKLSRFIDTHSKAANRLYNEAEKARIESQYTDIDALEQSCYNEGILAFIAELKLFIENNAKP